MNPETTSQQYAVLVFMGLVTASLLALVFVEFGRGFEGAAGVLVYGATAGLGLQYLGSTWSSFWRERGTEGPNSG